MAERVNVTIDNDKDKSRKTRLLWYGIGTAVALSTLALIFEGSIPNGSGWVEPGKLIYDYKSGETPLAVDVTGFHEYYIIAYEPRLYGPESIACGSPVNKRGDDELFWDGHFLINCQLSR